MSGRRGGHPAHQPRPFTVSVRCGDGPVQPIPVDAETGSDAVLRAGMALGVMAAAAGQLPMDLQRWLVTAVHDPAVTR